MPAIHSSLNLCFKPLFLSHSSISFSKFAIPKQVLNPRNLCALASADSATSHDGGRSGALSPPPIVEELQIIYVNPPKWTRDFRPEDMRLHNWLFHNFREVSRLFGFEEVDFPVLESETLFIRKEGEEIRDQVHRKLPSNSLSCRRKLFQ